ncbi:tyrosine-type recombinase/integrase [Chloroflexota bacterium]
MNSKLAALSLDDLIRRYEMSNRADGKSPRTISWYTDMLTLFSQYLKEKLHQHDISAFTIDTVREYIIYLRCKPRFEGHPYTPQQDKPISARTVQCHVRSLKAFASWLYVEGYTAENKLTNLKLPKAPTSIIEPLTPEEIKEITSSINKESPTSTRNYTLFITLLDTGLRASEAAGITLSNLNLVDGYIKVTGKGSKERIVPIGKYIRMTLWTYIDKVRPETISPDCNNLFLTQGGKPITVNTVKLFFSRLAKRSGVNRLHAHLCRHTFAINYLMNGGDIFSLREILGHTTLDMVNHYLHFTSSQITAQHHKYSPMDKLQEDAISKQPVTFGHK